MSDVTTLINSILGKAEYYGKLAATAFWPLAVREQIVSGWFNVILTVVAMGLMIAGGICIKRSIQGSKRGDDAEEIGYGVVGITCAFIGVCMFFPCVCTAVYKLGNPQYEALKDLIEMVTKK